MPNLANYRKLIAAAVGLTVLVLNRFVGINLGGAESFIVDIIIGIGTAYSVYRFPNTPAPEAKAE